MKAKRTSRYEAPLLYEKSIFLFFVLFFTSVTCFAQQSLLLEKSLSQDPNQKYLVQLPSGYKGDKEYPLFIAIHWHTGTAMQQVNEWRFLTNRNGYILLCPQFSEGFQRLRHKEDRKLNKVIDEIEQDYSIDKERIYLVGFSAGAQFAHRFAYKNHFIKAVCVLSPGDIDSPPSDIGAKSVQYFIGVGEKDRNYEADFRLYNLLRQRGFNVKFVVFPLLGHTLHANMKQEVMNFLKTLE